MIRNLMIKKPIKIDLDKLGRCRVENQKFTVKDIPAVIYNFDNWEELELNTIKLGYEVFKNSLHALVVTSKTPSTFIQDLRSSNLKFATLGFLHLDSLVLNIEDIKTLLGFGIDRLIIQDNTQELSYSDTADIYRKIIKITGLSKDKLGLYNSPFTSYFGSVLGASTTRELSALYCDSLEAVVPSSNHEDENGNIKYIEVNNNIEPFKEANEPKVSQKTETNTDKEQKKESKPKKAKGITPMWI